MSEWTALATAAQRLREVATQESLVARSADSGADDLQRARGVLVRLRARLHAARAAALARETTADDEDASHAQMVDDALLSRRVLQFAAQSSSLVQLFELSPLTADAASLKQETKENMQRLTELEGLLDELYKTNVERKSKLTELNKEWDKVMKELIDQKGRVKDTDPKDTEQCPEMLKIERLVRKMELMRQFLYRFLTARSGYNYLEDRDNLMSVYHRTRQPITVESVLKLNS